MTALPEKIGISITTYESSNKVLTHIFWGDTIKEAFGIAKAHLITDYFFSSSFEGKMPWGTDVLRLSNTGQIVPYNDPKMTQLIIEKLTGIAKEINQIKREEGIPEVLNDIGNMMS